MKKSIKIIAIFLCVVLCLGIFAHFSGVFDPSIKINKNLKVPDNASSDFAGIMLNSYDSISLQVHIDKFTLDFNNIDISLYKYICLDFIDSNFTPDDSYENTFSLIGKSDSDELSLKHNIAFWSPYEKYENSGVFGTFDEPLGTDKFKEYTYLLDMTAFNSNILYVHTFLNGIHVNTVESNIDSSANCILDRWVINAMGGGNQSIPYSLSINSVYLYAFEGDSSIKDCIGEDALSLYECKDSLLYGTNK